MVDKRPFKESAVIAFYAIFSFPGLLAEFTHADAEMHDGYVPPDKNAKKKPGRKV